MRYRTKEFLQVLVLSLAAGFVLTFCIYVLNQSYGGIWVTTFG